MSFKVVGIGEVLWDLMPGGKQLGGAPANFAHHAHSLGAEAVVITRVGEDDLGREILQRLKQSEIAAGAVQIDANKPTGTVAVTLRDGGVPHFSIQEDVAWDWIVPTDLALKAVGEADAICFGSLAQRSPVSRASIQQLMAAAPAKALRIFDINLREHYYSREIIEQSLRLANVLKLNDTELRALATLFDLGSHPKQQIQGLSELFELQLIALTRGPQGSLLYQGGQWSEHLSQPVEVVDTVGAGDAFTAALTVGLLSKVNLHEFHAVAAQVARFVCSHAGATPALPAHLRSPFINRDGRNASLGARRAAIT